jgi:diguanylate cyclase (GGDEF)-like protein
VSRWWRGWAAFGAVCIAAYLAIPTEHWLSTALYDGFAVLCIAVLVVGIRRNRSAALWWCLAAGQSLSVLGDLLFDYYEAVGIDPFPSVADALYLSGYPAMGIGLVLLVRSRARGSDRSGVIDASVVATGLTLLAWVYVIQPMARDTDLTLAERAVSVAYPACDVLLLVIMTRLFTTRGARNAGYWLLAGSLTAVLLGDVVFTALVNTEGSYLNHAADMLWMAAYLTISLAATHPAVGQLTERRPSAPVRLTRVRLAVLATATLLAPAVLIQQGVAHPGRIDWAPVSVGAIVLFILVVLRMNGLMERVQEQARQLSAMAHLDGLTGIANRRAWDTRIDDAMRTSRRTATPLSVALLDLDHFKRFNDEHGHPAGDRLLRAAASAWQTHLRSGDLLARYGGEEFAALLPGAGLDEAAAVVERMRSVTPDGQSFSAGVVRWDGVETADELIARVDASLYAAKRAGRDRVVVGAGR